MRTRILAGLLATLGMVLPASDQSQQSILERTKIFTCGTDETLPEPIPLWWGSIVLAADTRLYIPCPKGGHANDHREARESDVLRRAGLSRDPEVRWREVQAQARMGGGLGMLTDPLIAAPTIRTACNAEIQVFDGASQPKRWVPGRLFFLLRDKDPDVRNEAAYAIGVRLTDLKLPDHLVTAATKEIRHCLIRPADGDVAELLLEALGLAHYSREDLFAEAEAFLVEKSKVNPMGALRGLEALIRLNGTRPIDDSTRVQMRYLALDPKMPPAVHLMGALALYAARDTDTETLRRLAGDEIAQVRRLSAMRLNFANPEQARIGELLARDLEYTVRYELLPPLARLATETHECAPIVKYLKDPAPVVVMRAMDMLVASCTDLELTIATLVELADKLGKDEDGPNWRMQSRALTNLARLKPDLAKPLLAGAVKHDAWQVRAAAAATSVLLADEEAAKTLAMDGEPNVRTAALDALFRLRSPAIVPMAIEALKGSDYQLLRMAAHVLKGTPAEQRPAASEALLGALKTLTEQETDTSRDPRVAIIERLGEVLAPVLSDELIPYTTDYDDEVIAAARIAFEALVGGPPADHSKRRRYPFQPRDEDLLDLPAGAIIHMDGGSITLRLLPKVAPVTVARFAALVRQGFYKDLTFHRVVPNFVVQGGSPGANEYMGTARYMRDEAGPQARHVAGAVGISTRGKDTGDGQFFIDLVDLPRLDRDYTVFAYASAGVSELLESGKLDGARIINISLCSICPWDKPVK